MFSINEKTSCFFAYRRVIYLPEDTEIDAIQAHSGRQSPVPEETSNGRALGGSAPAEDKRGVLHLLLSNFDLGLV